MLALTAVFQKMSLLQRVSRKARTSPVYGTVSAVYWCHQERESDQDDTQRTPRDMQVPFMGLRAW